MRRSYNPFKSSRPGPVGRSRGACENPSFAEIMQPGELPEMALGRADAPVTIVQYASMTCPYCRQFQLETFPLLKREYIDTGKVRYMLRAEFPIGKQSGLATIALRCAPADKYFVLYDKLMAQQAAWVSQEVRPDPIFKVAAQVGMTRAQFDSCRENRGMIRALNADQGARAHARHHRHAELLRPGQAGEVGDRDQGDPRDGGSDPGRPRGRYPKAPPRPVEPGVVRVGWVERQRRPANRRRSRVGLAALTKPTLGCSSPCISTGCGCWASSRSWSRPNSWSSRG